MEYDQDEYLRCLNYAQAQTKPTPDEVRAHECRLESGKSFCVSQGETLYEMPGEKIIGVDAELLVDTLSPLMKEGDTIVEIGCGYGINLWELWKRFPDKRYCGGEYSDNAVTLANMLYADIPAITVEHCNFYDDRYEVLERCPPDSRVIVFTRHAIEQLPTVKPFLTTLTRYFDRIACVVHLEIVSENRTNSLLGLLRQRYIDLNDYNRDLLSALQSRSDIEIVSNTPDVYGINPMNPTSLLIWKPR